MMAFRPENDTLSETKIRNLHPKRDDEHPHPFHMRSPPPPQRLIQGDRLIQVARNAIQRIRSAVLI